MLKYLTSSRATKNGVQHNDKNGHGADKNESSVPEAHTVGNETIGIDTKDDVGESDPSSIKKVSHSDNIFDELCKESEGYLKGCDSPSSLGNSNDMVLSPPTANKEPMEEKTAQLFNSEPVKNGEHFLVQSPQLLEQLRTKSCNNEDVPFLNSIPNDTRCTDSPVSFLRPKETCDDENVSLLFSKTTSKAFQPADMKYRDVSNRGGNDDGSSSSSSCSGTESSAGELSSSSAEEDSSCEESSCDSDERSAVSRDFVCAPSIIGLCRNTSKSPKVVDNFGSEKNDDVSDELIKSKKEENGSGLGASRGDLPTVSGRCEVDVIDESDSKQGIPQVKVKNALNGTPKRSRRDSDANEGDMSDHSERSDGVTGTCMNDIEMTDSRCPTSVDETSSTEKQSDIRMEEENTLMNPNSECNNPKLSDESESEDGGDLSFTHDVKITNNDMSVPSDLPYASNDMSYQGTLDSHLVSQTLENESQSISHTRSNNQITGSFHMNSPPVKSPVIIPDTGLDIVSPVVSVNDCNAKGDGGMLGCLERC